ncbi:hypothetical protein ENBRE01_1398 [Enteropsectra breve]|nr:hypothetical protein ENBRE01_1398 [Enteropsectra breve]
MRTNVLLDLVLNSSVVGVECFRVSSEQEPSSSNDSLRRESSSSTALSKTQVASCADFFDPQNCDAAFEFLTSCSAFRNSVGEVSFKEKRKILSALHLFIDNSQAWPKLGRSQNFMYGYEKFKHYGESIEQERETLVLNHFSLRFKYLKYITIASNEREKIFSFPFGATIFSYSDLHLFREKDTGEIHPKIFETFIERAYLKPYEPHNFIDISTPDSLIFALNNNERSDTIETRFSVPMETEMINYRIKVLLLWENGVLTKREWHENPMENDYSSESFQFFTEEVAYVLYEKE